MPRNLHVDKAICNNVVIKTFVEALIYKREIYNAYIRNQYSACWWRALIARFMGPMLALWTLLSGVYSMRSIDFVGIPCLSSSGT